MHTQRRRELFKKFPPRIIMPTYLLIVGTRPEVIKLAPVAAELRKRGAVAEFCAIGQHGDLLHDTLDDFGEIPRYLLLPFRQGRGPAPLLSRMLELLPPLLREISPDGVIVQGDTTTAFGAALAAFYGGISPKKEVRSAPNSAVARRAAAIAGARSTPDTIAEARSAPNSAVAPLATAIAGALRTPAIVHVEAGLRTYSHDPYPEEAHRRMIAPLADLHLSPTEADADALRREGVPGRIAVTGNSGLDGLRLILSRPAPPLPEAPGRIVLCTLHRRENTAALPALLEALGRIIRAVPDCTILFPMHPSPDLEAEAGGLGQLPRLKLLPPLPYPVCAHLLPRLTLLITDSGGLQEEAAFLGIPTLVLREKSERGEAPSLRIIGADPHRTVEEAIALLTDEAARKKLCIPSTRYGDGFAAGRMAEEILRLPPWGG